MSYLDCVEFPELQKTSLWPAMSDLGRRVDTPSGVLVWGSRADQEVKKEPGTINATVGIAQDDDGTVTHLPVAENFMGAALDRTPKAKVFGYAPIPGVATLRQKWKARITALHPELSAHITDPVVTNGITHGLYLSGQMFLNPGETVIFPEKSWENYFHTFGTVLGLKVDTFPLFRDGQFFPSGPLEACEHAIASQKKVVLLLNFPHNQTGYMPSTKELQVFAGEILTLCRVYPEVPFVILIDDAYEGYVYDEKGQKNSPYGEFFAKFPNLTIVKLDGISKIMLAYGARVGFVTGIANTLDNSDISPETNTAIARELTSKWGGLVRGEVSQISHHGQVMADALLDHGEEVEKQREKAIDVLRRRWRAMMVAIQDNEKKFGKDRITVDPCNSGFFCFLNLTTGESPTAFVERLIAKEKVVVFPAESDKGLRVAFCSVPEEKIAAVVEKIFRVAYA